MGNDATKTNHATCWWRIQQADIENLGDCLRALVTANRWRFSAHDCPVRSFKTELDQLGAEFTGISPTRMATCLRRLTNQLNAYFATVPGNYALTSAAVPLNTIMRRSSSLRSLRREDERASRHELPGLLETDNRRLLFNLHTGDVAHPYSRDSGSGSPYLCVFLLQNAQKYKPLTFIFDIAHSSRLRRFKARIQCRRSGTSHQPSRCLRQENCSSLQLLRYSLRQRAALRRTLKKNVGCGCDRADLCASPTSDDLKLQQHHRELKERLHRWPAADVLLLFDNAEDRFRFSRFQTFNFHGWKTRPSLTILFYVCIEHRMRSLTQELGTSKSPARRGVALYQKRRSQLCGAGAETGAAPSGDDSGDAIHQRA